MGGGELFPDRLEHLPEGRPLGVEPHWFDWKTYNPATGVYGAGGRLASGCAATDAVAAR